MPYFNGLETGKERMVIYGHIYAQQEEWDEYGISYELDTIHQGWALRNRVI